jgi:hypothetical protein
MSKPPAGEPDLLHRHAQAAVLAGLQRGEDIDTLVGAVARYDIPGRSLLPRRCWSSPSTPSTCLHRRADLLEYEGLRQRYLPEIEFRGRTEHRNSQYAL